jgi:hypothetical protein
MTVFLPRDKDVLGSMELRISLVADAQNALDLEGSSGETKSTQSGSIDEASARWDALPSGVLLARDGHLAGLA